MAATNQGTGVAQQVIYRVGANSANQPMTERMTVGIVEAGSRAAAVDLAAARWPAQARHRFDPVLASVVSEEDYEAAWVAESEDAQHGN